MFDKKNAVSLRKFEYHRQVLENDWPEQQLTVFIFNPHDGAPHHSSSICVWVPQVMLVIISSKKIEVESYSSCRSDMSTEYKLVSSSSDLC